MKIYLGGMIKEEQRGRLAVIVNHDILDEFPTPRDFNKVGSVVPHDYMVIIFKNPVDPRQNFQRFTGDIAQYRPVVRIYYGISKKATNGLKAQEPGLRSGAIPLDSLDSLVVDPFWIPHETEKADPSQTSADQPESLSGN